MKRLIKILLVLVLLALIFLLYFFYFKNDHKENELNKSLKQIDNITEQNNKIKNLKYEVEIKDNAKYMLSSDESEIINENNKEKIKMKFVIAKYIDEKGDEITIKSNEAIFNNETYETKFFKNVKIIYKENIIYSDNVDVNFKEKFINVFSNVKYMGLNGVANADNIDIDLTNNVVSINMNDKENAIEIFVN